MSFPEITYSHTQSPEIQIARLEMMLEVSRVLNSTLDLDVLLQSIIEIATRLTDTEAASILLIDKKTGELYFEATTGEKQAEVARIVVPLEGSIAGWIARNGEPLVVDNIHKDRLYFSEVDQITHFKTRAILGVPLKVKERTIGVLEVLNKKNDNGFNGDDIHALNTLAAQAAVAIENARLFEQSDQLASVFHELRSPMASIIGYSELMLTKLHLDKEDLRMGLESIKREAVRLSQMINDFLDLTHLETGRIRLERHMVDLRGLTQEVVDLLQVQAREHRITLILNVENDIPFINGDANRLKQVIVNLVDNALKYNHEGGLVEIKLSHNNVRVRVSVRDTGTGIPPDELGLVFDKFYRIQDHVKGIGLGLPIAKKIIEAHGGDIWVESEIDVGSKFTFSLPLS